MKRTKEIDEFVKRSFGVITAKEITSQINISDVTVKRIAREYGLKSNLYKSGLERSA